ncbi:MAG: NUDIX hydrolase, partial [Longimicrobiales bacterium]
GPEVLLLKRLRSSGFVPGAFVFPGGRVDAADASVDLIARTEGMTAEPEPAYWMAAAREAFEETGLLLGMRADGTSCARAADDALATWRARLLADETTLIDVLTAEDIRLDFRCTAYCAHWITPVAEPRRYDTRFFLAEVPPGCVAKIDEREMSELVWLTPMQALRNFEEGTLPMVFPTVRTLHELARFQTIDEALDYYRTTTIRPIQPRLVRRDGGYGLEIDDTREDA